MDQISEVSSSFRSSRSSTLLSESEYRWPPCLEIEEIDQGWITFSRTSSSSSSNSVSPFLSSQSPAPWRSNWMGRLFRWSSIVEKTTTTTKTIVGSLEKLDVQHVSLNRAIGFKAFTKEELYRATNNYCTSWIIGKGGCSVVYKGILDDQRVVAVKKFRFADGNTKEAYANEKLILSQINHVNVVKLLGWCSEVEESMLVLEYVPNGTLFELIHQRRDGRFVVFPLDTRLRIAAEAAEALAYLHSGASPSVLHRGVKSLHILLDEHYTAKVVDFGNSILVSNESDQFTKRVIGTIGYIDPQYITSSIMTDKTDVYGLGVVLLELLTRKKATDFGLFSDMGEAYPSLVDSFFTCLRENRLLDILDPDIKSEGLTEQLQSVIHLASQCLRNKREERPTMKEVRMELEASRKLKA